MGREVEKYNISEGQEFITRFLEKLGLTVESEVRVGLYRVDCYLPELKTVVEFDGPWMHHSAFQHSRRDVGLKAFGVKEVIHVSDTKKDTLEELARQLGVEE